MMADEEEYYDDGPPASRAHRPITPITPFAVDPPDDDMFVSMRVIGITPAADDPCCFEFVVLKQTADGEIVASIISEVFGDLPAVSQP